MVSIAVYLISGKYFSQKNRLFIKNKIQIIISSVASVVCAFLGVIYMVLMIFKIIKPLGFMVYIAVIISLVMYSFFRDTKIGLKLRSVGESPATADAAGINVSIYKYSATTIGCALCGMAGMTFILLVSTGTWSTNNNIEAIGWLSVALVIFSTWKPVNLIWGSYLFGLLFWAYNYVPTILNFTLATGVTQIWQMLPYVVTIIILIVSSIRNKRENQPPASLGLAYFREDR